MSDHHAEESYPSRQLVGSSPSYYLRANAAASGNNDNAMDDEAIKNANNNKLSPSRRSDSRLIRRPTKGSIRNPVSSSAIVAGLMAGITQAAVFNPYDRALYLSVKEKRRFLAWQNWQSPYRGLAQSIGGRAVASGLFFPLEHLFLRLLNKEESLPESNLIAGTAAGAVNAILINPLTAIKYKTWGRQHSINVRPVNGTSAHTSTGLLQEAVGMFQKSNQSLRPFFNGLTPTLGRDVVFGGCYTSLRLQLQWWWDLSPNEQYKANLVAAALATVVSGPLNYARNVQFATSSRERAPTIRKVFAELAQQVHDRPTVPQKLALLQRRFRIGWGTARVALGMTLAHAVYDGLQTKLQKRQQYQ